MLILYDTNHNKIGILANYKDYYIQQAINIDELLYFSYPIADSQYPLIAFECYIRNEGNEYIVKEINAQGAKDGIEWAQFVCRINLENLKGQMVPSFETVEQLAEDSANLALIGTGWTVGYCDVTKLRTVRKSQCSVYDIMTEITKAYVCEIIYDAIHQAVYIHQLQGADRGAYFAEQLNLSQLQSQSNSNDYITQLIPIGKDGLDITSVNNGVDYVSNYQYSTKVLTGYWIDNRYTSNVDSVALNTTLTTSQVDANAKDSWIGGITSDNKLTGAEKSSISTEMAAITSEFAVNDAQATTFEITTEKTAYDDTYNALNAYITPLIADTSVETTISGSECKQKFDFYYLSRNALLSAVVDKANIKIAAAAQTLYDDATERLAYLSKPIRAYSASIVDLANVSGVWGLLDYSLGDFITLLSESKNVRESQRIVKLDRYLDEPERSTVQIANRIARLEDIILQVVDAANTVATATDTTGSVVASGVSGGLTNAQIPVTNVDGLTATIASVGTLIATEIVTTELTAINENITNLTADKANVTDLTASTARIDVLEADSVTITQLDASTARITTLEATTAHIVNGVIDNATIDMADINSLMVGTANIADAAITNAKIGTLAVSTAQIQDAAIVTAKIGTAQITSAKIGNAEIKTANIALGNITTALIATGAIGTVQIADGSITDAKIVTLTANKISAGTIDAANINVIHLKCSDLTVGTINGAQITPGAIGATQLATAINNLISTAQNTADGKNEVTYSLATPGVAANSIGDIWFQKDASNIIIGQWEGLGGTSWLAKTIGNAVIANLDAGKITTGSITAARIAAGSLNASVITANTITAAQIAAGIITATQIAAATITGDKLVMDAITTREIAALAITATEIAANTITAAKIAAGTITAIQIAATTITAAQIFANTITAAQIAAGTITATQIAAGSITADKINVTNLNVYKIIAQSDATVYATMTTAGLSLYKSSVLSLTITADSGNNWASIIPAGAFSGVWTGSKVFTDSSASGCFASASGLILIGHTARITLEYGVVGGIAISAPGGVTLNGVALSTIPPGQVAFFAMSTPPAGWLKLNGATISRYTYADLFAAIGTIGGPGDGVSTFALPDMRGYFARGWDDGRGVDSGRSFGSGQAGKTDAWTTNNEATGFGLSPSSSFTNRVMVNGSGSDVRPNNVALLVCIKY